MRKVEFEDLQHKYKTTGHDLNLIVINKGSEKIHSIFVDKNMTIRQFKLLVLHVIDNQPFSLQFNLMNDALLSDLIEMSHGKTIKVFTDLDHFDMEIVDENGLEIEVKNLCFDTKLIEICQQVRDMLEPRFQQMRNWDFTV